MVSKVSSVFDEVGINSWLRNVWSWGISERSDGRVCRVSMRNCGGVF